MNNSQNLITAKISSEAIRILDEAERIVLSSPTGKLRVVDVAAALGMSHANIYRYFTNRDALLNALVHRWLSDGEMRAIAARDECETASDQLKNILLRLHIATKEKIGSAPGVLEIYIQAISKQADAVDKHREFLFSTCAEIIKNGISTSEFAISEQQIVSVLTTIETAIRKFTHPYLIAETLSEDTQQQLEIVLEMFLKALKSAPEIFGSVSLD